MMREWKLRRSLRHTLSWASESSSSNLSSHSLGSSPLPEPEEDMYDCLNSSWTSASAVSIQSEVQPTQQKYSSLCCGRRTRGRELIRKDVSLTWTTYPLQSDKLLLHQSKSSTCSTFSLQEEGRNELLDECHCWAWSHLWIPCRYGP